MDPLELRNQIQEKHGSHPVPWFRWLFERLHLPGASRVLEVGSGGGWLWLENRARIPTGWKLTLSDRAVERVREAREVLNEQKLGEQTDFMVLDAQALPFKMACFEAVLAIGVLDFLPHLAEALQEARRVLRPGGVFIASAGGRQHLGEMEDLLRPYLPEAELGGTPEHFGLENGTQNSLFCV